MCESLLTELQRNLSEAEKLYYRLVILVGASGSAKTRVLRAFSKKIGVPVLNLNLELSKTLLETPKSQQARNLPIILETITHNMPSPLLLDNIELLFYHELKQDPLSLLKTVSRNRTLVVSWNGSYRDNRLTYADQNHPDYRNYGGIDEFLIVCTDSLCEGSFKKNL